MSPADVAFVLFLVLPALIAFGAAGRRTGARERALLSGLGLMLLAAGGAFGTVASFHYYDTHSGDWRIGVTAIGIGLGFVGAAFAVAVAAWSLVRTGEGDVLGQARRWVIHFVTFLLPYGGGLVGAAAGYSYRNTGGSVAAAVAVGIASALGAWLLAALLGLLVEIANSLRKLAAAVEQRVRSDESAAVPRLRELHGSRSE